MTIMISGVIIFEVLWFSYCGTCAQEEKACKLSEEISVLKRTYNQLFDAMGREQDRSNKAEAEVATLKGTNKVLCGVIEKIRNIDVVDDDTAAKIEVAAKAIVDTALTDIAANKGDG